MNTGHNVTMSQRHKATLLRPSDYGGQARPQCHNVTKTPSFVLRTTAGRQGRKLKAGIRILFIFAGALVLWCSGAVPAFAQGSSDYVNKAWSELGKRNFDKVYELTNECIDKFHKEADGLAKTLSSFPPQDKMGLYKIMNDVATCYFIKGEALMRQNKRQEAKRVFKEAADKYPFAQSWDPRGWFWSIKEKSEATIKKLETGKVSEGIKKEKVIITKVNLYDEGAFPVDYDKYGEFTGVGTKNYKYIIKDPVGLSKAAGEGIYPNTSSVKFDPAFVKIKKKMFSINHWKILNSRDLSTAFYKWNLAPEPQGVRQFYIADILERSGLIEQAVKAYYAVLVHFPRTVGWTYWKTPWYIGKAALYRLKYLLDKYPRLGLSLKGASIKVVNGFDNNIRNDIFIVNPGKLIRKTFIENICRIWKRKRKLGNVVKTRGSGRVKLLKYAGGDWRLLVNNKPFIVKAVTYSPTKVGESPDEGTLENWTTQDINENGLIDGPYDAWVDKNENNDQDSGEKPVGDFQLMKDMGVNAIRVYHQPFKLNKKLFRQMYEKYGIYILLGDFLGKYAIGSGATWEKGTDYDDLSQQKNMLDSVRKMVLEFKDEPYVLIWILGNENVYGLGCNADKKPESFFKFANKAARLIKELDPLKRPVLLASGDALYLDVFAKNCPDIDIFGTNAYRGHYGFLGLFDEVKSAADKPVIITEYGAPSYYKGYTKKESQDYQAMYHRNAWRDIYHNSCGFGAGNSLGGIAFEWLDEWWKAYEPAYHDRKGLFAGPFLDGYMHEEWLGICSQGNGKHSPFLRQLKKAYFTYQGLWNNN
ncbi:MAG: hypothetical protein B1H08_05750 [Candidatus Omnitrophica bacterium 4484_171]|nr:MAG: hypothetical protein B1H08_05750 [Candidatus Omnitrophica bacterium 4484_171]